jgi:formate-dependent nitrite reductase membrane component NrfD
LVKGGYSITIYGGLLTLLAVATWFGWNAIILPVQWITAVVAVIVAVYTAFLFAQAKGRDFWQSPTLSIHMLVHSFMAGAAAFAIINLFVGSDSDWSTFLKYILYAGVGLNLFTILIEMMTTHPTEDAKRTVDMILHGRYRNSFWFGAIIAGNIIPVVLLLTASGNSIILALAGVFILIGIYITEHIWVEAPQRIPLS